MSHSFVGTDGITMKATMMDAIKLYDVLDGEGTVLDASSHRSIVGDATDNQTRSSDATPVVLPKIQIILATKSAEAGINSKFLKYGKVNGLPSLLYELAQQLGRLDCDGTAPP